MLPAPGVPQTPLALRFSELSEPGRKPPDLGHRMSYGPNLHAPFPIHAADKRLSSMLPAASRGGWVTAVGNPLCFKPLQKQKTKNQNHNPMEEPGLTR